METQNASVINSKILEALQNDPDDVFTKKAQAAADNYTRMHIREDSFAFKVLPPQKATREMLRYDITDDLAIVWEREPDSPAAKWVPLRTVPEGEYIKSSKYIIPLTRIVTSRYKKDIAELLTTKQDIRKILTDNAIKDGLAEIDAKFIRTVNSIVFNADGPGKPNYISHKIQWIDFPDRMTRETLAEATKMLPRGNEEGKFVSRNYCMLMNEITARDLLQFKREDIGGDKAQEFFLDGLTENKIFGIQTIFTIKNHLVPTNWVYFFAEPDFLGKCFYMDDWTMFVKKEAFFIEMFSYWMGGFAFGNTAAMALARFQVDTTPENDNPAKDWYATSNY